MFMIDIRIALAAVVLAIITTAIPVWYYTAEYKEGKMAQERLAYQKATSDAMQEAQKRIIDTERKYNNVKTELELKNEQNKKAIELANTKYLSAVANGKRLLDPGTRGSQNGLSCNPSTTTKPVDSTNRAELSREASEFLFVLTRDADNQRENLKSCIEWANKIKEMSQPLKLE